MTILRDYLVIAGACCVCLLTLAGIGLAVDWLHAHWPLYRTLCAPPSAVREPSCGLRDAPGTGDAREPEAARQHLNTVVQLGTGRRL